MLWQPNFGDSFLSDKASNSHESFLYIFLYTVPNILSLGSQKVLKHRCSLWLLLVVSMGSNSPPQNWGISRQSTANSHKSPSRIQSWLTSSAPVLPQQADQEFTSDSYRIYRLDWSDLKAWLEDKFPGLELPDRGKVRAAPYSGLHGA